MCVCCRCGGTPGSSRTSSSKIQRLELPQKSPRIVKQRSIGGLSSDNSDDEDGANCKEMSPMLPAAASSGAGDRPRHLPYVGNITDNRLAPYGTSVDLPEQHRRSPATSPRSPRGQFTPSPRPRLLPREPGRSAQSLESATRGTLKDNRHYMHQNKIRSCDNEPYQGNGGGGGASSGASAPSVDYGRLRPVKAIGDMVSALETAGAVLTPGGHTFREHNNVNGRFYSNPKVDSEIPLKVIVSASKAAALAKDLPSCDVSNSQPLVYNAVKHVTYDSNHQHFRYNNDDSDVVSHDEVDDKETRRGGATSYADDADYGDGEGEGERRRLSYGDLWKLRSTFEKDTSDSQDTESEKPLTVSFDTSVEPPSTEHNDSPLTRQTSSSSNSAPSNNTDSGGGGGGKVSSATCASSASQAPHNRRQNYRAMFSHRLQLGQQRRQISGDTSFDSGGTDGDVSDVSRPDNFATSFESAMTDSTADSRLVQQRYDSGYKSLETQASQGGTQRIGDSLHAPDVAVKQLSLDSIDECQLMRQISTSSREDLRRPSYADASRNDVGDDYGDESGVRRDKRSAHPDVSPRHLASTLACEIPPHKSPTQRSGETVEMQPIRARRSNAGLAMSAEVKDARSASVSHSRLSPVDWRRNSKDGGDSEGPEEYARSPALHRPPDKLLAQSRALSRDYSIDKTTDAIFNEFMRFDPQLEVRAVTTAGTKQRTAHIRYNASTFDSGVSRLERLQPGTRSASLGSRACKTDGSAGVASSASRWIEHRRRDTVDADIAEEDARHMTFSGNVSSGRSEGRRLGVHGVNKMPSTDNVPRLSASGRSNRQGLQQMRHMSLFN